MRERIRAGDNHHYPHPDKSTQDFIDPRTLSKAVDAILPTDRVVASDSGHFCGWVPRYLRVPNARASCLSHSFQSVGLGLPSAIGLAIANPGKLAVLGTGDGGFLMSIADLETAIRLGLRMCILVYNDSSYAAEVHYFGRQGFSVDIVRFPETDFAAIARGYGARGATVRTLADLEPVKAWVAEGSPGVFVIDGKINPNLEADWHAEHFPKDSPLEIPAQRSRRQIMQHPALDEDDGEIGDAADESEHHDGDEHHAAYRPGLRRR